MQEKFKCKCVCACVWAHFQNILSTVGFQSNQKKIQIEVGSALLNSGSRFQTVPLYNPVEWHCSSILHICVYWNMCCWNWIHRKLFFWKCIFESHCLTWEVFRDGLEVGMVAFLFLTNSHLSWSVKTIFPIVPSPKPLSVVRLSGGLSKHVHSALSHTNMSASCCWCTLLTRSLFPCGNQAKIYLRDDHHLVGAVGNS